MWSAIARIFAKNTSENAGGGGEAAAHQMDRTEMDETANSKLVRSPFHQFLS